MEEKDSYAKLEISGFTNSEIKPEPKEVKTITVNAAPGWYTKTVGKAVNTAKNVGSKLRLRRKSDKDEDETKTIHGLMIKTAICACIALTLLLIKNIDSPFTNSITKEVKSAINTETDLEKEIGRLKFVQNIFGSEPVLSEITNTDFVYPVQGSVTKKFGQDGSRGIMVETTMNSPVLSIAGGKVASLKKEANGTTIRMQGNDGTEVVYMGVVPRVKEGDNVKMGGILGTLKGNTLSMEVYQKGKAIDPLTYMSKSGIQKE